LILTYGIPTLSFVIAYQLGAVPLLSPIARKTAHLAVASPPLFTLIGVAFYIAGLSNADYVLWGIVWIGASILILTRTQTSEPAEQKPDRAHSPTLRVAHGISALVILIVFLLPHIANHLTAIWNVDLHKTVMQELRRIYRTDIIQPLLVTLILQTGSGLVLWRTRMRVGADFFGTLQTAAGIYLAIYIVSHMMAVFVLGRVVMKVDTDFLFASGAPTGLLHDPWNVRLIPHYSLAVCALFIHLACGLRGVLRSMASQLQQRIRLRGQ
jgi:succinate dehydrogenase hydrophobic anchor subunit